jgi:glutathione S-transferase
MLELYQFEGCPFCARVRETLDDLGLDYIVRTVPHALNARARVIDLSGQARVPVLVDPERLVVLPESADIIAYLKENYGGKRGARG